VLISGPVSLRLCIETHLVLVVYNMAVHGLRETRVVQSLSESFTKSSSQIVDLINASPCSEVLHLLS
jgi:hypothetical protein